MMNKGVYQLSAEKRAMWGLGKIYENDSPILIIGEMLFQDENIIVNNIERAINQLLESNDILRTRIIDNDKETIEPYRYEKIQIINSEDKSDKESTTVIENLRKEKLVNNEKLYKFIIIKYNSNKIGILIMLHHIISDAWTMVLISNKIYHYYTNRDVEANPGMSYKDYITKDNAYIGSKKYKLDELYWENKIRHLRNPISKLYSGKLGIDNIKAKRKSIVIDGEKIRCYCKKHRMSLFTFYVTVLAIYIARMNQREDIIIGTPILGRKGIEKYTLGYFVNMVPLILHLNMEGSLDELIIEVKKEVYNVLKHSKYPFTNIREEYIHNYGIDEKIFDIVLSYQNANHDNKAVYTTRWVFNNTAVDGLEIHISDRDNTENIICEIDYQTNKYTDYKIEQMIKHFTKLIDELLQNKDKKLCQLNLLPEDEQNKLVYEFNDTHSQYDNSKLIHELFMEQVIKTPNKVAVIYENEHITYNTLNEKSNRLARTLRKKGVSQNTIVGIIAEPSIEMIIGILAILKSGGAYLPIDISHPTKRIMTIIEASNINTLLIDTKKELSNVMKYVNNIIDISHEEEGGSSNLDRINSVDDLCYILYTSGSTGQPKGIMTSHKNVVGYIHSFLNEFDVTDKRVLQQSSYTFDLFTEEVFPTLVSGGTLIIGKRGISKNIESLMKIIIDYKIQVISSVPAIISMINKHLPNDTSLELIISGGNVLRKDNVDNLLRNKILIYNTYGPTETTVCATYNKCNYNNIQLIGRPISNYTVYIMDEYNNIMPIGYDGEIVIGGVGVCKGYLKQDTLTNVKFIISPYKKGEYVYKTGDRGRILEDGNLEFRGRLDRQVKILGNRVELHEIEEQISKIPGIIENVVICNNEKNAHKLIGYYTGKHIKEDTIKEELKKSLPPYMIPHVLKRLKALPLTTSGKVDINKLLQHNVTNNKYEKPRTQPEKQLVELYKQVLEVDKIGTTDDFFHLGGDSLKVMEFILKAREIGLQLDIKDVYNHSTIKKLLSKDDKMYIERGSEIISVPKKKVLRKKRGSVLITGSTGWLGSHLLHDLLKESDSNIYCVICGANSKDRLTKVLESYFDDITLEEIERIKVIKGDITIDRLGLNKEHYAYLKHEIKTIIHSAAFVKYHGEKDMFCNVNVTGTKNVISMTKEFEAELYHISTITVCGNYMIGHDRLKDVFTEEDFYIGQHFEDNEYINSKFLAEKEIINEIEQGLNAHIVRVGNLTGRVCDGRFQNNINDSGFYGRIKELLTLRKVPIELLDREIEITPVDECSQAIITMINNEPLYTSTFHIYNPNKVKVERILKMVCQKGYKISQTSTEEIMNTIISSKKRFKHLLSLVNNEEIVIEESVIVDNDETTKYLEQLGFTWSQFDDDYLYKIIRNAEQM